jgi:hypothetical protein
MPATTAQATKLAEDGSTHSDDKYATLICEDCGKLVKVRSKGAFTFVRNGEVFASGLCGECFSKRIKDGRDTRAGIRKEPITITTALIFLLLLGLLAAVLFIMAGIAMRRGYGI